MDDDKKVKIIIALVIVSIIFFIYRICGLIMLGKNTTKLVDEFYNSYLPLSLAQYFDKDDKAINVKELQAKLLDNEVFNMMMEGFEPIDNNQYENSTAVLFYNVIYCASNTTVVNETTDEEKKIYSNEYKTATYKIKRKDFNNVLKELTGIEMKEIPNMEELIDFVKYDKKSDTYYVLEKNEKYVDGNDREFNIRMLDNITKGENDTYTLTMHKYDIFGIYSNTVNNSKELVNEAKVGDYRSFYEKCVEKDKEVSWQKEVVTLKELPGGIYTKYEILDKKVYDYTIINVGIADFIYPKVTEKIDDNTYKINLVNSIVELTSEGKYLDIIVDDSSSIILKSEIDYSKDIGKEVGIRGKFVVNGKNIEFVEEALDWMKNDNPLPTVDWDSLKF